MMKNIALSSLLMVICFVSYGQGYREYLSENPDRVSGVHHCYEYIEGSYTPAPKGYKPFYISHYGRHGARYHSKESYLTSPIENLDTLAKAGLLNSAGLELLDEL